MFLGFEIRVFKPLSAQGERGRFPRVDGFSFGRWGCGGGVAEAAYITSLGRLRNIRPGPDFRPNFIMW